MKAPNIQLTRNLRRSILQGDPWVYKEALHAPGNIIKTTLCRVHDNKNDFVCWGMYNPHSPLALRVLSLEKQAPTQPYYEGLLQKACDLRKNIYSNYTNCYRLINGEGDFLPGIICDVYAGIAVIQFDGLGPYEFWDQEWLAEWLLKNTHCTSVYYKPRHDMKADPVTWGEPLTEPFILVKENNALFYMDIINGQKTGYFLDQRDNRNYVRSIAGNKSVIDLFGYYGGFAVNAGLGGAKYVMSVDIAQAALDATQKNWQLNKLNPSQHQVRCADVFEYINQVEERYDIVICDPPSLVKSEKYKDHAVKKYIEVFSAAARRVKPSGHLILSSCSSHIDFNDFNQIIVSVLSKVRKRGQILRMSGQGADHPYPHVCPHLRYLKFADLIIY